MSGAGEIKNSELQVARIEAESGYPSAQAAVRQYWRNGMNWTVYRTDSQERPRLKAMRSRISRKFRNVRKALLNWLMQPWP